MNNDDDNVILLTGFLLPFLPFFLSLNVLTISQDSSLLAGGFSDSLIKIWTLTPKKLHPLKSTNQMQQITLSSCKFQKLLMLIFRIC